MLSVPTDCLWEALIDGVCVYRVVTTTRDFFLTVGLIFDAGIVVCKFFRVVGKFLEYRLAMLTFETSIAVQLPLFASSSLVSSDFAVSFLEYSSDRLATMPEFSLILLYGDLVRILNLFVFLSSCCFDSCVCSGPSKNWLLSVFIEEFVLAN